MSFGTVADATRNNDANRKLAKGILRRNFKRSSKKNARSFKRDNTIEALQFGSNSDTAKRKRKQNILVLLFVLGLGLLSIATIELLTQ